VVVNPGEILNHRERKVGPLSEIDIDSPFPCLMFLDSFNLHNSRDIGKIIRGWLNYEWDKAFPGHRKDPYNRNSMVMALPNVPRQPNTWDCGVYVCRYVFGLLHLCRRQFSYRDAGISAIKKHMYHENPLFPKFITDSVEFQFDQEDVVRMRIETKILIENLSTLYKESLRGKARRQPKKNK